jgi:hypothetical protein
VDLSALIFVALAVAWAVYLIPKALKHHEDDLRSRTVDKFSTSMRVVASREPVDSRTARLTVPGQPAVEAAPAAAPAATPAAIPATAVASRAAQARATKRRRRVLALILLSCIAVGALAGFAMIPTPYVAIPAGLLVAWLVACRLMVKSERAARTPASRPATLADSAELVDDGPVTEEIAVVEATAVREPGSWDPVPVTLPTYVSKEPAGRRSVRTIDLDSTGVWTSGHDESDSRLAREADEAEKAAGPIAAAEEARRAAGS